MGLGGRKHILPAPTESLVDESTVEEHHIVEESATDLSQQTDRTHHTIPEDGSPITIRTNKPTSTLNRITKSNQNSQTSLLIEYFEAGKDSDPNRRPSVRVKVVPSSKIKSKDKGEGHVILTEGVGPQFTRRRISLSSSNPHVVPVDSDVSILDNDNFRPSRKSAPLDIQVHQDSNLSSMSGSPEARYIAAPSDISSMPADSMLGVPQSTVFAPPTKHFEGSNLSSLPPEGSAISDRSELVETTRLKPPVVPRERNASSERIAQQVIEKLSKKPRAEVRTGYGQSSKSSSRSASRTIEVPAYERTGLKSKNFKETDSTLSPSEPSMLSNSAYSIGARSAPSERSAVSNNSINNPKLLQTVEDAIRRLILPELKELKRENSHRSRSKYDKDYSDVSEESIAREKSARRSVSGDKIKRRKSGKSHGDSSRRRRSSQRDVEYDSMSDASSRRGDSISSISADDPKKAHKGHKARDMAAAGLVGAGLTAAALEARDSDENLHRRRRRKRSKSRSSRSASIAESEEAFSKHKIPPMPMQSDINSELTRSSILSSNTGTSHTPTQHEVRHIARGSPTEALSPVSDALPRGSGDRQILGMHHNNFSEHNLSSQRLPHEDHHDEDSLSPEDDRYHSFSAEDLLEDPERMRLYERNLHTQHPIRRGLSPIQSVASYQTTEANRNSMMRRSVDSIASTKRRQQQLKEEVSLSSFTSASPEFKKGRPQGLSLENRSEILRQHDADALRSPEFQSIGIHDRFGDDDLQRDSYAPSEQSVDQKHLSGFTDASSDIQYVDKVTAGQHVVPVSGARPEIIPAPFGVESGVASLVEASVLSMRDSQPSQRGSFVKDEGSTHSLSRDMTDARMTSPFHDQLSVKSEASLKQPQYRHAPNVSPPQSPARSYEEHQQDNIHEARRLRDFDSPSMAQNNQKGSPQSEITTNPSIIHGPIGGANATRGDLWMDGTMTPPMPSQGGASRDFTPGATDLIPEGLNVSQRNTYEQKPTTYVIGGGPPPQVKDEGYATGEGDNYPSPAPLMKTGPTDMTPYGLDDSFDGGMDDPFTMKRDQYMSGFSQGMSPLYDTATGKGIERIESKDIIYLMEHLMVRDAQRNARDTEILMTLVKSAAEMRNEFEAMRQFIADQDDMIMDTSDKQHAQTQKVIGGPRQMPAPSRPNTQRSTSQDELPTKRKNVFNRALQRLGSKNTTELQNIEGMLMHLLDEVEALRSEQASRAPTQPRTNSITSDDNGRAVTDTGYEPEGRAGTASSRGDMSTFMSNNSSRQNQYSAARRVPENRVSTVMEGDEDYDDFSNTRQLQESQRTPRAASPSQDYHKRGLSEPLHTPPRMHDEEEITPTSYGSSEKKHKTFSSFLPNKFVSRWSKTTASTEPEYRTPQKQRPYTQQSRSGSQVNDYEYENNPDDRLRSATSLQNEEAYYSNQENRPPSPLVPSALSANQPKYQAHRNSQNLQHPQPRQGPTDRYQHHLESAAQDYHNDETLSPISQPASLHRYESAGQQGTYAPRALSPISDDGMYQQRSGSQSSLTRRTQGPPRPPKITESNISDLNEPLVPRRPVKSPYNQGTMSPSTYVDDVRAARAGSPAFDKSPMAALRSPAGTPGRKPSGPRPLSASSNKDTQKRTRFAGSPAQSPGSGGY